MKLLKYKTWTLNGGVLVAQELRLNRQFGGIQRQIGIGQGQLKMLNTISAQKEKALSVLAELRFMDFQKF